MSDKDEYMEDFEDETVTGGVPTLMLLPPRPYKFIVYGKKHKLTIPRRGKYVDLDAEFFTEEDGEFDILKESDKAGVTGVVDIPALSSMLFAVAKYPNVGKDQAFTPRWLVVKENEVDIIGHVIQMLREGESENVQ